MTIVIITIITMIMIMTIIITSAPSSKRKASVQLLKSAALWKET